MGGSMVATKARETKSPMALTHSFPKLLPSAGGKQQKKKKYPLSVPFFLDLPKNLVPGWLNQFALVKGERSIFFFGGT